MLGNLSIREFAKRAKVTFSEKDAVFLETFHSQNATVPKGMFHIFDIPFRAYCGDEVTAEKLMGVLSKYDFSKSPSLQVTF